MYTRPSKKSNVLPLSSKLLSTPCLIGCASSDNGARDSFLKNADNNDHRCFSVVQHSPSDVLETLTQMNESDSIPQKDVKDASGEPDNVKKDNSLPVKEGSMIYRTLVRERVS